MKAANMPQTKKKKKSNRNKKATLGNLASEKKKNIQKHVCNTVADWNIMARKSVTQLFATPVIDVIKELCAEYAAWKAGDMFGRLARVKNHIATLAAKESRQRNTQQKHVRRIFFFNKQEQKEEKSQLRQRVPARQLHDQHQMWQRGLSSTTSDPLRLFGSVLRILLSEVNACIVDPDNVKVSYDENAPWPSFESCSLETQVHMHVTVPSIGKVPLVLTIGELLAHWPKTAARSLSLKFRRQLTRRFATTLTWQNLRAVVSQDAKDDDDATASLRLLIRVFDVKHGRNPVSRMLASLVWQTKLRVRVDTQNQAAALKRWLCVQAPPSAAGCEVAESKSVVLNAC